ncbi:hypothetical protein HPB52_018429 [Rhipicephalus sanguineus]|uniref:HTH psq-type domain-containing protein n=1 Tax=Rhipicephalus sanguineus TaxID=34632 RepID=A0A9D4PCX7_RHISA|nr:hypothetical protein HPB52_018429 [Rhipicephalus sanguineus]
MWPAAPPHRACRNLETARVNPIHRVPSCFVLRFSSSGFAVYSDGTDCSFVFVRAFEAHKAPFTEVGREFGISKQTVSDFIKNKVKILEVAAKSSGAGKKNVSHGVYPQLEEALLVWLMDSMCDELPSADVAFDDLRAAGVSIPDGITFEGFADADKDLELCAKLTDDDIVRQVTEDSDDSDTENEEPDPTQPTSSELTRALMTLSSVYSGNMTLNEIEADMIGGKRNAVQKKISDFFVPKCCLMR